LADGDLSLNLINMSLIRIPVLFETITGNKSLITLFDTETNFSCINNEVAQHFGEAIPLQSTRRIITTSSHRHKDISEIMILDFTINDVRFFDSFFLVEGLSEEIVIGASTIQRWKIKFDSYNNMVIVDPKAAILRL
jgi:hypothetical protein